MRKSFAGRAVVVLGLWLAGCAVHPKPQTVPVPGDPWAAYNASIFKAAVFEPESPTKLRALKEDPAWVVTWTRYPYKPGETVLQKDVWVTLIPEVQEICQKYPPGELILRLQQLIGLPPVPPDKAYTHFAVLRVHAGDVFRPCADPNPATEGPCPNTLPADVSQDYLRWFAGNMLSSYQVPNGYPWTRLGYTYNWDPAGSRFGVSEFVVCKGARICVEAVVKTADYCSAAFKQPESAACPCFPAPTSQP
jgi:hypothetical protein